MKVMAAFLSLYILGSVSGQPKEAAQSPHGPDMKKDCQLCHNTKDWTVQNENVRFNHRDTKFPLTEGHLKVRCRSCHRDLNFTHVGTSCSDCHTDYHQGRMGKDCAYCHTAGNWEDRRKVRENHERLRFPLVGAHAAVECEACHGMDRRLQFANTSTQCKSCHLDAYDRTADPDHRKVAFSTECIQCHTQNTWKPSAFNHNNTGFPLTGVHQTLNCSACHQNGFKGTPKDCFACHETNYKQAADPNHFAAQFPPTCAMCHNAAAWKPSSFNHDQTALPLKGAHRTLVCSSCHKDNRYVGTPSDCYSCHEKDFTPIVDPSHVTGNFDRDCLKCHTQNAWKPSTFNHSQTGFPLVGAHTRVNCSACHTTGYAPMPADCYSCHKNGYNAVADPSHVAGNFDRDCLNCHTQNAWKPSTFNHNNTGFPLTGAHQKLNCSACHQNGFIGTPKDCIFCHQSDYDGTSNPSHRAAGFSLNCQTCHNSTQWQGAIFNHDQSFFPIYFGSHARRWNACTDCHPNSSSFTVFTCTNCHSRSSTDNHHDEVSGYRYNSSDCYRCHPRGRH